MIVPLGTTFRSLANQRKEEVSFLIDVLFITGSCLAKREGHWQGIGLT